MGKTVYGYTRIDSDGGLYGKESDTFLFYDRGQRDDMMYDDYASSFDSLFDHKDANGNQKLAKEDFMKELMDGDSGCVIGLIQSSDSHMQFEPFCKDIV